jgi:hypothetical protein
MNRKKELNPDIENEESFQKEINVLLLEQDRLLILKNEHLSFDLKFQELHERFGIKK